ncbi:carbohydrate sulfotransferase 8, partial [Silurus meridionalis]
MLWPDCKVLQAIKGRRRSRWGSMRGSRLKISCSFWFVLLFGAGGLVLFIHLQDLSDMVQQQGPDLHANYPHASKIGQGMRPNGPSVNNYISPVHFPAFNWSKLDQASHRVTKRHRKLLKTSSAIRSLSNSSSLSSPTPKSWQHFYHMQKTRHKLIKEVCAKYRSNISQTVTSHHVSRIYVEDRHKLLYCEVPKAGCSNWKRVLMVLAGVASSTQKINHETVHYSNHLTRLDSLDQHAVSERLRSYTKVLFIREPMERLVSAYRDKFESPNSYYHPVFGKPIISKYRVNASKSALRTGSGVTFQEFIRYLLDVHRPIGMDIHWEPVSQLCSPCLLDYDFIGKFETIEEEANFLLHRVGAPKNLTFPTFKDRNPEAARTSTRITQHYFTQLSASDRQRVYDFYYMDYLMFNYSKPFHDVY